MRIQIATDGSQHADAALQSFLARPWPSGSQVQVVSVTGLPYPLVLPYPPLLLVDQQTISPEALATAHAKQAQVIIDRATEQLKKAGYSVEGRVRHGDARVEIVQAALEFEADLVMLGSNGRTGLSRWLLGSVAEYVVRHAPCSVEVARFKQPPERRDA